MVRTLFVVLGLIGVAFSTIPNKVNAQNTSDRLPLIKVFSPNIPPAGDCRTMSAQYGADKVWFGRFSGRYQDDWNERMVWPVNARGCFKSEYECRRWLNEVQSAVVLPGLMSCKILAAKK